MKRARVLPLCIAVLMAITLTLYSLHDRAYTEPAEGTILIRIDDREVSMPISEIRFGSVSGELVNGKGEHKNIDAEGIDIRELLTDSGFEPEKLDLVTAVASDSYTAEITGDEIMEPGKVCLILQDGNCRLVVFGDPNSKRAVRDIVKIIGTMKAEQ